MYVLPVEKHQIITENRTKPGSIINITIIDYDHIPSSLNYKEIYLLLSPFVCSFIMNKMYLLTIAVILIIVGCYSMANYYANSNVFIKLFLSFVCSLQETMKHVMNINLDVLC